MVVGEYLEPIHADCVVVGGGIAGCWTALKLHSKNIKTVLIYYSSNDRGGNLGSTALSAGAINTSALTRSDYKSWIDEMGRGQVQANIGDITETFLGEELEELKKYDVLKPINLGVALKSGSASKLTTELLKELKNLGVEVIECGWVVKINASEAECHGLQYQLGKSVGSIVAGSMVLASGGYSSLYQGALKTGTYGSIHGRFLEAGGQLSNAEFVFKHGYGLPDIGGLTPTEELPGVEIYHGDKLHLKWLEEELFYGKGTNNHFQAFMTWRKNPNRKYYIDFRYRDLHRLLKSQFIAIEEGAGANRDQKINELLMYVVKRCNHGCEEEIKKIVLEIVKKKRDYNYQAFGELKSMLSESFVEDKHRIRQIAYYSMGGMMHDRFKTNLKNVFVTGEAMHDFGAHRVGGLPWALYLCSARSIAEDISKLKEIDGLHAESFPLVRKLANFNVKLLSLVQMNLQKHQENGVDENSSKDFLKWIRQQRKILCEAGQSLDDAFSYLLVAEAIMVSSLGRKESRGSFYRIDFKEENADYANSISISVYDKERGRVVANLIDKSLLFCRST